MIDWPIIWSLGWALFKKFWWVIPVVVGLGVISHRIYESGRHSRDAEVSSLKIETKKWHDAYDEQIAVVEAQRTAHTQALAQLQKDQSAVVVGLKGQLDEAKKNAGKVRVVVQREIQKITQKIDADFPLPNIFVRVHDTAARGDSTSETIAVSGGDVRDDGAPSGIAISVAAGVVSENYAECLARGEVIKAWQTWYTKNRAAWESAAKLEMK